MSTKKSLSLAIALLHDEFSLLRFRPETRLPQAPLQDLSSFVSVTRTPAELSLIVPATIADQLPESADRSDGWHCMRIETTTYPSEMAGILASVVAPLAAADISVFAVASFDTDHVLVQDITEAQRVLSAAGHIVHALADPGQA